MHRTSIRSSHHVARLCRRGEIDHACRDAIKASILTDKSKVEIASLLRTFQERSQTHPRKTLED